MAERQELAAPLEPGEAIHCPWATPLSQNAAKYAIVDFGQAANAWGVYRQRVKAGQRPARRVGFPRYQRRKHERGFRADNVLTAKSSLELASAILGGDPEGSSLVHQTS